MGLEKCVRLQGDHQDTYFHDMVIVPHKMFGLEGMLNYRGVGLQRFHCYSYNYIMILLLKLGVFK